MSDSAVGGPVSGASGSSAGAAAPLQLIREKETELSRRVLSAKREADEIIADARRQAASIIESATQESATEARERLRALDTQAEQEARRLVSQADEQAASLSDSMGAKLPEAVDYIITSVIPN